MSPEIFLADANTFITLYLTYYSFDFGNSFWNQLEESIHNGNVVILDMVMTEISKGKDPLAAWIQNINVKTIHHKQSNIISKYSEILSYLQNCGYYKPNALSEWSRMDVADPWLIAAASEYSYTLITQEAAVGKNLNPKNKCNIAKIPDVCSPFQVKCKDLFYMMRQLSFNL